MMMATPATTRLVLPPMTDADASDHVRTRFGDIMIDTAKAVHFPRGLLGMPHLSQFVLSEFPSETMRQFKLLQSLDDMTLSFISLPLDLENALISKEDIIAASEQIGIALDDLALLLIVSVHRTPQRTSISVNARAPLFIDAEQRLGVQYVFHHDRYSVQHVISG